MDTYYIRLRLELGIGVEGNFAKVLTPSKDALDKYIEKYLKDLYMNAYTEAYFFEVILRRRKANGDRTKIINTDRPVCLNKDGDPV